MIPTPVNAKGGVGAWKGGGLRGHNRKMVSLKFSMIFLIVVGAACGLAAGGWWYSPGDPVAHVLSNNLHRRHMTPSQLSMVGDKARAFYDKKAKERMSEGGKSAGRGRPQQGVVKLPPPVKSRDDVGKAVGVSGRTVDYGSRVLANGAPELVKGGQRVLGIPSPFVNENTVDFRLSDVPGLGIGIF